MATGGLWDAMADAALILLGVGVGAFHSAAQERQSGEQAAQAPVVSNTYHAEAIAAAQGRWWGFLPLPPEPGIHWTRTGGKSWRVVIVRDA
jgi:hypothetical protein